NGTYSNGESSIFADNKALRQAICYAINKDDLVIGAIDGTADPLDTPYPEFVINYPEDFDGNVYNPELAKEKLAEAGYPDGLTIKIRTTTQAGYSKPAEVIMGQLSEIGITLELETMERGTYLEEVYNNFDYDMTIWAVSCDYPDANHGAYRRFYSGMISPANNYMKINDYALDDAIMINRTSADPAEKAAAVLRMAEIIRDESYCLPLYSAQQTLAANANLKGVNINSGMGIDFYRWSW
ncbi:MAG: ABC transporter substrate-binding protein, partial [Sporomusa sp.]